MTTMTTKTITARTVQFFDVVNMTHIRGEVAEPTTAEDGAGCFPGFWVKGTRHSGQRFEIGVATSDLCWVQP